MGDGDEVGAVGGEDDGGCHELTSSVSVPFHTDYFPCIYLDFPLFSTAFSTVRTDLDALTITGHVFLSHGLRPAFPFWTFT